jgi:hypothetical protein
MVSCEQLLHQHGIGPFGELRLVTLYFDPWRLGRNEGMVGNPHGWILLERTGANRNNMLCLLALTVDRRAANRAEMAEFPRDWTQRQPDFLSPR